jgi:anaerobic selenocysteine-containing dehydrogenase
LRGIHEGERIRIVSEVGVLETTAKITNLVVPGVIAVSAHCGHWEYGRFASGKRAPETGASPTGHDFIWWERTGANPNWIVPNSAEPASGQQRWMDTVVTVNRI